jgi:hypothetical protein
MRSRSQILVVLLMATLLTAMWPMQLPLSVESHGHPSGCHEQGGKAPAHGHDCCLTGHDVALPQNFHLPRPSSHCACSIFDMQPALVIVAIAAEKPLSIRSADPPGFVPLRI